MRPMLSAMIFAYWYIATFAGCARSVCVELARVRIAAGIVAVFWRTAITLFALF